MKPDPPKPTPPPTIPTTMSSTDFTDPEGDRFPDYEPAEPVEDWESFHTRVRRARDRYLSGARLFIRCTERINPWIMYKPEYRRSASVRRPAPPSRVMSIAETEANVDSEVGRDEVGRRGGVQRGLKSQERAGAVQAAQSGPSSSGTVTRSTSSFQGPSVVKPKPSIPSSAKSPPKASRQASSTSPQKHHLTTSQPKPASQRPSIQDEIIDVDAGPAPPILPAPSPRRRLPFSQSTSTTSPRKSSQKPALAPPKLSQKSSSLISVDPSDNATTAGHDPTIFDLEDDFGSPSSAGRATSIGDVESGGRATRIGDVEEDGDVDMIGVEDMPTQADLNGVNDEEDGEGIQAEQAEYTQIPGFDTQMLLNQPDSPVLVSDGESASVGRNGFEG
ncbi:hypothetical protein HK097_006810, partial [Rhizophlyctis rosea]